jgi:eukaryotic-like serine/threonine-protein kinase
MPLATECPHCGLSNPPGAAVCTVCSTPLPISDQRTDVPVSNQRPDETAPGATSWVSSPVQSSRYGDETRPSTGGWSAPASPVSAPLPRSGSVAPSGTLEVGRVIGNRYEILQLLGEGGMGAVYKARDGEVDRFVALKIIRPELASRPDILARFKQELILARQVTHKNVIRIFDLGEADGMKFITMDFVEGHDLKTILREKGKFTHDEAVKIITQLCRALDAAHTEGVIHRDLKPQNIMVDAKGRVTVMDFGIARSLEMTGMTQTGSLVGTPEYMSPEQAKGEDVDARSDLFTVGIIFYELLTGKTPFHADTTYATLLKRTHERARAPMELDPGISPQINSVVMKCLETDREQRYASALDIVHDIGQGTLTVSRTALSAIAVPSAPPSVAPGVSVLQRYRLWLAAGAAVIILAVVGIVFRGKIFPGTAKHHAGGPTVSLLILPLRNASGDPSIDWMGQSLAEMLRTDVGQSASLRTVSSDRLHQIQKDLRIPDNAELDQATLHQIAEFTSTDRIVSGEYAKLGQQIRIDATLQDLKQQHTISLKAEAPSEKQLLQSVAQLAQAIQQNLALSSDALKELRSKSFRPSSDSVEALRDYNEGLQLDRNGNNLEAAKRFQAAVQQDPQFALAYSRLALTYSGLGYDDKAEEFSRKASDLAERLPPQEKYLILANDARISKDNAKAIEAYENLAKASPDDPDVHLALGELYVATGALDKARAEFAKVLARDPKQVEALYYAGRVEVVSDNPQSGLDYLNRSLSLAVQLDNDEEKAKILQAIGISYQILDKLDDALRSFQESLAVNRRLGEKSGMAASLSQIAQVQQTMGKLDAAVSSFNEALQLSRGIGDKQGTADTLNNMGLLYDDRGNRDQALKLFKESLQLERDVGDETRQALRLNNIGHTYFLMGDLDNARTYFEQALGLYEKLKNTVEIADAVHNLAEISLNMGQYDQARTQYLRALDLRRNSGDKRGVAMESFGLGTLFEYQGRYGAQLTSQEEAVKAFRDAQDRSFWMATVVSGYGHALSLVGRYDEAQKNFEEALTLSRELKNESLIAQTLDYEGDSLFYRGEFKSARPLYDQALQEASRSKDRNLVLLSKISLARLDVHEGRSQMAGTLRALAQEADAMGLKYFSVECSVYLGEVLLSARQYSPAQQELETALRKGERLGLKALLAQAHYLLAETLKASGNLGEPALHLREARRLLEEIHTESHSDAVVKREDLRRISADVSGKP